MPTMDPTRAIDDRRDFPMPPPPRTWDGRLARRLVTPLRFSAVSPNQLTTLRLAIGVAGAAALAVGGFRWANIGAALIVLSNFVDHTDGELARISGRTSRLGHFYDLASDALVTVLLFTCMGVGVQAAGGAADVPYGVSPIVLGVLAGVGVALIFFLRMRIESLAGKAGVRQGFAAGFETEDVLYLLPLVTLSSVEAPFLVVAAAGSFVFALWTAFDYVRVTKRAPSSSGR
jgi:archaetidylinositol phosphate synthase